MPSKKTAAIDILPMAEARGFTPTFGKRTRIPRASDYTKQFLKDWERLSRSGRYDMNLLKEAMLVLISGEQLDPSWRDHPLTGPWEGFRECHIGGDFLLIYQFAHVGKSESIVFTRAGTHTELFD